MIIAQLFPEAIDPLQAIGGESAERAARALLFMCILNSVVYLVVAYRVWTVTSDTAVAAIHAVFLLTGMAATFLIMPLAHYVDPDGAYTWRLIMLVINLLVSLAFIASTRDKVLDVYRQYSAAGKRLVTVAELNRMSVDELIDYLQSHLSKAGPDDEPKDHG